MHGGRQREGNTQAAPPPAAGWVCVAAVPFLCLLCSRPPLPSLPRTEISQISLRPGKVGKQRELEQLTVLVLDGAAGREVVLLVYGGERGLCGWGEA